MMMVMYEYLFLCKFTPNCRYCPYNVGALYQECWMAGHDFTQLFFHIFGLYGHNTSAVIYFGMYFAHGLFCRHGDRLYLCQ